MTHWGYGLLVAFVVLGLSSVGWRKAGRLATMLAFAAIGVALHSYGAI